MIPCITPIQPSESAQRGGQQRRPFRRQFDYQFAEEGVGPGKPWASEAGCVILLERLVHDFGTCRGIANQINESFRNEGLVNEREMQTPDRML
jgi:hypothetical protein